MRYSKTTTYQLIDSVLINDLLFKIEHLTQRLESTEQRFTALDLRKSSNNKHDYRVFAIFVVPERQNENEIIDEYIFCTSLEEGKTKEIKILKRRQGIKQKILTLEEVSFKSALYS